MMTPLKTYLPQSLFGRTLLIILVPALLLQVTVSIVFFDRHWSKMTYRLADSVAREILYVLQRLENEEDSQAILQQAQDHFDFQITYEGLDGALAANKGEDAVIRDLRVILQDQNLQNLIIIHNAKDKIVMVSVEWGGEVSFNVSPAWQYEEGMTGISNEMSAENGLQDATETVSKSDYQTITFRIPEGRLYSSSNYIFILWMIGLSVLFFAIALMFMRNQIRPIRKLGVLAERMGRGQTVDKIRPSGAKEIRQTTQAFIDMQKRIQDFVNQRTLMLAGVSHDLRTPLTRLKLQLEMEEDNEAKALMLQDLEEMEKLIGSYLSFAKGDADEEMQRMNLHDLIDKAIQKADKMPLVIKDCRADQGALTVNAKPLAIGRAFDNVIRNANDYAKTLRIEVEKTEDDIRIIFSDDGPGIDPDKIDLITRPFLRGDEARGFQTSGTGLGLAIVSDILAHHGGGLEISNDSDLGGLKVVIILPV